jgi:predicted negative regulator of RcsB-dependent stress response
MDYYVSDDEQVEALKKWWQANWGAIITGTLIGLAVVFGWQYWTSHRASWAEQASVHYHALLQAAEQQDLARALEQGQVLRTDYGNSAYTVLAALELARLAVAAADNTTAIQQLEWALKHARQDEIKDIARLRLVRLLLAEKRYDEAEARLDEVKNTAFTAEREELKGDLYMARNDPAKARQAYQAALAARSGDVLVQMKLDNLPPPAGKE